MEVKEAVLSRRSIRAFRPDPVPRQVLEEIIETALWAPSWGNTQPWGFTVVGGTTLETIRREYVRLYEQGVPPSPELPMPIKFNEVQTARYKGIGKRLFVALGIGRDDEEKRRAWGTEMTRFFGAPCVIFFHLEKGFDPYALMDGGLILQTIALLAVERALGTCFLARSVHYPQVVRRHASIPQDRTLVMGLAVGYPLPDHPANTFPRERGAPEEFIQWVDVD